VEKLKRVIYGASLAACVCIPILGIGNSLAIYNVVSYLAAYIFVNAIVAALLAWKVREVSWIVYVVIALLLYPQFLFLWTVIFGCAFGGCLSI
jgi:hypothetical protein